MPRHSQDRARKDGDDRALAFDAARDRAICQLDVCEKAFNEALASTAEMIRLVDSPRHAIAHLDTTKELRLLVRRLQRRLESA